LQQRPQQNLTLWLLLASWPIYPSPGTVETGWSWQEKSGLGQRGEQLSAVY